MQSEELTGFAVGRVNIDEYWLFLTHIPHSGSRRSFNGDSMSRLKSGDAKSPPSSAGSCNGLNGLDWGRDAGIDLQVRKRVKIL